MSPFLSMYKMLVVATVRPRLRKSIGWPSHGKHLGYPSSFFRSIGKKSAMIEEVLPLPPGFSKWTTMLGRLLQATDRVVGRISAITDGVSCAYITHLEVLPEWQGKGIGSELVRRMVTTLENLYMIDLVCDDDVSGFYAKLGFKQIQGMAVRNYDRQNCEPN